ncbi:MAG TPA: hypothetical protein VEB63_01020 [Chitinophagaceae bacterium]|nr:hypothetical protein [Chitinophagaceae bacterium]
MAGFAALFLALHAQGQKDTAGPKAVEIVSGFKPMLKESAKIYFGASPAPPDTSRRKLTYDIPNQNLLFAYQPGSLKPLALDMDTSGAFDNSSYVKAGFGSLRTPLVQAGITFGDGRSAGLNIYAKHVASESKRPFQKFAETSAELSGYFKVRKLEWNGALGMRQDRTYKYGFEPQTLSFPEDSLKQNFQTISARMGFRNIDKTEFGLTYAPVARISIFSDHLNNSESNTVVDLPLQKTIAKIFEVNLALGFDLTRLSPKNKSAINNTMYHIAPSVRFKTRKFNIQAGIRPTWDNGDFEMFPNVLAEIGTEDQRFFLHGGWTGYVRKTTYQYLASQNPWLWLPSTFRNTWIEERFLGIRGSIGDHFTYATRVAVNRLKNQPLFVNDTAAAGGGKSFVVVNEPAMNVVQLGGEVGFNVEERFSLIAGWKINEYRGLKNNHRAWGLLPLEFNAAMRVQVLKDLFVNGDLFAWSGSQYMTRTGDNARLKGATDLNAGVEFRITKNLNLWAQFNNITNKKYQRWNQYPVYGFSFLGGVVFSFDQKNK